MKVLFFSFFLFVFGEIQAQNKYPNFFSDSTTIIGIQNFFQKEDIYTFLSLELYMTKNILVESGFGNGWRSGLSNSRSLAFYLGFHYNLSKYPRIFYGPSLRGFHHYHSSLKSDSFRYSYSGGSIGYRFAFGSKWKVVQASYSGIHNVSYNAVEGRNNRLYFGYSFQLGFQYVF